MNLHCPLCGAESAIMLNLQDGETMNCPECGDDFTVADLTDRITEWQKAIKWIATMPKD
jgi:transcription initiation factor IIE alpha subunit